MTTEDQQPKSSRLRPAQVAATSLAAVTGAFLASRLGVYGTVIGAGVLSVMSTVGTELYLRSLDRTKEVARAVRTAQLGSSDVARAAQKPSGEGAIATIEAAAPANDDVPAEPVWRRIRWRVVAGGAAAAFLIGMVVVSGIELVGGSSLQGGQGTTIGAIARSGQAPDKDIDDTSDHVPADSDGGDGTTGERPPEEGSDGTDVQPTPDPEPSDPSDQTGQTDPSESADPDPEPTPEPEPEPDPELESPPASPSIEQP